MTDRSDISFADALDGAKALAARIVAQRGRNGDAEEEYRTACDAMYGNALGASQMLDIWRKAAGLDLKTGLPPGIGDDTLQPPHVRD